LATIGQAVGAMHSIAEIHTSSMVRISKVEGGD
jgi:hypothetical protein